MYTKNNDSLINFFEKYSLKQHIESLEKDPSLLSILFTKSDSYNMYIPSFNVGNNTTKIPRIDNTSDNKITEIIRDLAQVLSHNTTIKSFDFSIYSSFKPDPKAIAELAAALKNNKSITSFRSEIKCEFEGTKFAEIFKANTTITSLYFHATQERASEVFELFEALKTSTSITSLSVCGTGVTAAELVDILKTNKSLKHLIVDSNVMKNDDSMTLFSQALATNTTLASFKIAKYLTKVGAGKLTEGLRINTGLKHFGVTAGGGSEEGADLVLMNGLATVLNENQTLNSLNLLFSVPNEISEFFLNLQKKILL